MSDDDVRARRVHAPTVLDTYRAIRLAVVLLVLLLATAVATQALTTGCWQTSLSAYYWTGAHDVVVGVLCAVGACLLVYRGSSPLEDTLLDLSGFLAFVVALVPAAREPSCGPAMLAPQDMAVDGVRANVLAALLVAALAQAVAAVLERRGAVVRERSGPADVVRALAWVLALAGGVVAVADPDRLAASGHDVAAPAMFAGIVVVVAINAWQDQVARRARYARVYAVIALAMLVTLAGVGLLRFVVVPEWTHAVLVVEALLVAEFAAFWLVQTVELWHVADRRELMPPSRG
ncbi:MULTISPECIES: hypothetical protein [unclassified Actinotalea]|uniref:hypothetical protein n=1 Tax=unclassified Actinotalea TaxID=2638618 RepID=UPI0015F62D6F|nr:MULTISPECIES: hypothetical protein [unclassified Actinotalea]